MHAAKVVVADVQRHRRRVVFELLRKGVGQTRKPPRRHANGQVLPLDITGRNVRRNTAYYVAAYCDYSGGAVAARSFVYRQVGYAVCFGDDAMGNAVAKSVTDCGQVRRKSVSRNLRGTKHT